MSVQLSLFESRRTPTWDDVQKGRAVLVDRIGECEGDSCMFWHGKCTHTSENYAFPKKRPNGKCLQRYLEWA